MSIFLPKKLGHAQVWVNEDDIVKVEFAGTNQVSKEKIAETLQKIADNGDPVLEFDFYSGADDIFKFATKASLLKKSLN